ncbi:hypothetical protein ACW9HQ_44030, partial [Nocardia gipuzkoensis]
MASPTTSSVASAVRIPEIDMLRGFALFGILITNAVVLVGLLTSDAAAVAGQLWRHDGMVDR